MNHNILPKEITATWLLSEFHNSQQVVFPNNTIVVHHGDSMSHMYYINKGIVRGFYVDENGKEVTKCFSKENDIFGVESFLYHRDASYSIECLEEVTCIKITYDEVRNWMIRDVANAAIVNETIVNELRIMEERSKLLLLSDAKERYQRFLIDYGEVVGRLTQKCIASYLGINEASFCRLKRKLT